MSAGDTRWFRREEPAGIDRFHIAAVTVPLELARTAELPLEIRFVLARQPDRLETFRRLLEAGYGIGIRTVDHTPVAVLDAARRIATLTQENTLLPWLAHLLRDAELPVFTEDDLRRAERQGFSLYEETRLILERRYEFKKFVLIDLHNRGLSSPECDLIQELNEELYPYAIDYIVNRIVFDYTQARTEIAQSILKAMVVIGPIAHLLEHWVRGIGKLFAASVDDVLGETAELTALRGSGFTWTQLLRRSRFLILAFILATAAALSVEPFIREGRYALAGILFGLAAVLLSLTTALQSVELYRKAYRRLFIHGKLSAKRPQSFFALALNQDFTNPARLGLFVGVLAAPCLAGLVFVLFPEQVHNGWVLALLGSVESVVAGATVIGAKRLNRWMFRSKIRRAITRLAEA